MTSRKLRLMTLIDEFTRSPPSLWIRFTATERREGGRSPGADRALARRSMHGTLHHRSGAYDKPKKDPLGHLKHGTKARVPDRQQQSATF